MMRTLWSLLVLFAYSVTINVTAWDPCESSRSRNCSGHGICIPHVPARGQFICECEANWNGMYCEDGGETGPCTGESDDACGANGDCRLLAKLRPLLVGVCSCKRGWTGRKCQNPWPDPCEHRCSGHGVCEKRGQFGTDFACNCSRGYYGETCDQAQPACILAISEGRGCQNGAICRDIMNPFEFHCDYPNGITGQHCEAFLNSTAIENVSINWKMWIGVALIAITITIIMTVVNQIGRKVAAPATKPVDNNNAELGVMPVTKEEDIYTEIDDADCGIYELPRRNPPKRWC